MTRRGVRELVGLACACILAGVPLGMVGCSHQEADIYRNPAIAVRPTASYALAPNLIETQPQERDPRVHNALLHERIRSAITSVLGAKGYRQSSPESADFLVQYRVGVQTAERDVGGFVSRRNPAGPSSPGPAAILTVTRSEVSEGTLMIELVERQTGTVAYRAEGQSDNVTHWDASEWAISKAVKALLQDL